LRREYNNFLESKLRSLRSQVERLKDSSQLGAFNGKFINPRNPKIEQVVEMQLTLAANQISKSIDVCLKEIAEWDRIQAEDEE